MVEFKNIELSDQEWVNELLKRSDFRGCEFTFNTMFLWRFVFGTKIARLEDRLLVRSGLERFSYLFPAGSSDLKTAVKAMMQDAKENQMPFQLHSVNQQSKAELEVLFGDQLFFLPNRDDFDYIYEAQSLRTLKGKKLHGKRNHINRFLQTFEGRWVYEPITSENIHECMQMNKKWCHANDCYLDDSKLEEQCSVAQAFRHFFSLDLQGGLLRVDGDVVAFTIGQLLNSDTFLVHIEKAFAEVQGAYPMINQQFAQHTSEAIRYINREDDTGAEGLRKAKLSYRPAFLEEKYLVFLKEQLSQEQMETYDQTKKAMEEVHD